MLLDHGLLQKAGVSSLYSGSCASAPRVLKRPRGRLWGLGDSGAWVSGGAGLGISVNPETGFQGEGPCL